MLTGVSFKDEEGDFSVGAFVDKFFDKKKSAVFGIESGVGFVRKSGFIEPIPRSINIGEIGND